MPKPLLNEFAPDLPELIPGSFIDDELKEYRTDLLYRVKLKKGGEACVYVLVEHKSSPDPLTPLQLLGYKHKIWSHMSRPQGKVSRLSPIIPLVVYHGARAWRVPLHFHNMFAPLNESFRDLTASFSYILTDLGHIEDERLSTNLRFRAELMALKYNPRPECLNMACREL